VLVDDVERLLEYVPIGPRFSNQVLQTLMVCIKRVPPSEGRKIMVIATTSNLRVLQDMDMKTSFKVIARVPLVETADAVRRVFEAMQVKAEGSDLDRMIKDCTVPIGIKQLIEVIEMARGAKVEGSGSPLPMSYARFMECLQVKGLTRRDKDNSLDVKDEFFRKS